VAEHIVNLHVERLPEGCYLATSDEVPGLVAQGRTLAETLEIARDVAKRLMEAQVERGDVRGVSPLEERFDHPLVVSAWVGRLAGYRYREIVKRLKRLGFTFDRQAAGSHEIWFRESDNRYTTIPNHPGDMPEGTLRAILRQAGISVEAFLSQ
jgi:predicted RNA binding protein YcfA (HicA-like mRNA interferase family)/predicted RNase H-like HicB family nuclease